ncbi:Protein BPS1 [Theobroma cacao]|nr:Protein BPS1 [Theobroma cacao]
MDNVNSFFFMRPLTPPCLVALVDYLLTLTSAVVQHKFQVGTRGIAVLPLLPAYIQCGLFFLVCNLLPSRPHPLIPQIDEHLCRLKSNEAASSSSPSIHEKQNGLRDLYELVDSLLQLPLTQKSLAQKCNDKQVNELLNGSLRLLDVCGVAKDALLQAKEDAQELQSILRRRRGDEAGVFN